MTDLRSALARVAGPVPAGVDPGTVDADLARGRRALRRRRTAAGAGALVLVTAAAGVVRTAGPSGSPDRLAASPSAPAAVVTTPPVETTPAQVARAVRLVAFTGAQPSGYEVAYLPAGWEVQGADPFAMVIAPTGFADQHPHSFSGKLVVMLRSSSDAGVPAGKPIRVGKGTGWLNEQEPTSVLTYRDTRGHWVQVQVPPSLGWTDAEIGRFGAGVVVTGSAQAGVG